MMKRAMVIVLGTAVFHLWGSVLAQGTPVNSLIVEDTGDVGIGTGDPLVPLHVFKSPAAPTNLSLFLLENNGASRFDIVNNNNNINWFFQNDQDGTFKFSKIGTGGAEIIVSERDDAFLGKPTLFVRGSIQATNVTFTSSREKKDSFKDIDTSDVLNKVLQLPITTWRYIADKSETRHIGPISEDFSEVFDLGGSSERISVVDVNGIALAAIQGLKARQDVEINALREENQLLQQEGERLRQSNEALAMRMSALEKLLQNTRFLSEQQGVALNIQP